MAGGGQESSGIKGVGDGGVKGRRWWGQRVEVVGVKG